MPDTLVDIVRAWPVAELGGVAADDVVPLLGLKSPNGSGEETRCDEVQKAGGEDEEQLQFRRRTAPSPF